jgi:quinol monooxygenase YgiN
MLRRKAEMKMGNAMDLRWRTLVGLLAALGAATVAFAQEDEAVRPPEGAVVAVTHVEVAAGAASRAIGILRQYREGGEDEAGSVEIDLLSEIGRPYRLAIVEVWENEASFTAHAEGATAAQLGTNLSEIQSAPPDMRVYQGVSLGPSRPRSGGRAQLFRISTAELSAANQQAFRAAATPYAEGSRNEEGNMRLDVLQGLTPNQNQISIVEAWTSPPDFEAHRTSAMTREFRDSLAALATGTYSDNLYGMFD